MKYYLSLTLLSCLLVLAVSDMRGQDVREKFVQYRLQAAQEKVYVHTDRERYITGETMQASIFVVDGSLHHPSDLSKVAYLELLNADNESVVQAKIALKGGRGGGSVFLPATLSSGNYVLRAYTRWMKNFNSDFFFQKKISVVNTFVRLDKQTKSKPAMDVQFFPEGGNWIAGAEGKMGFKVTNAFGQGVDFRGSLIDERNDTVLRFHPHKFGMGSFAFRPVAGKSYRAVVATQGLREVYSMPTVATSGYSMSLKGTESTLLVEVYGPTGAPAYLFAHARQIIVKAIQKTIADNKAVFEFKVNELPAGITHFTVFDVDQRPVCERLYFKNPTDKLNLEVKTNSQTFSSRKEIALDLTASNDADVSISVFKADSLSAEPQGRILEYLWLTSDLKGFIESPEFYFGEGEEARIAADNLMLTQGWRRFKWEEVLSPTATTRLMPENHGHLIDGITKGPNGDTAGNVRTYLSSPDQIINVYGAWSDAKGNVVYDVRDFYGRRKIVTANDSIYHVELLSPFSKEKASIGLPPLDLPPATRRALLERSVAMQVQNVYYEDVPKSQPIDSISFYGHADETYLLDDFTRFPVLEEVLREYVPGVFVRKNKNGFHFMVLNDITRKMFEEPMILLDGVPIFDADQIMEFDPLKIKKLEVMKRTVYSSLAIFPGLISFSTYEGDLGGFQLDSHYATIDFEGLNMQREFYSPQYESQSYENLPDPRTLLYWNSSMTIGKEAKRLRFFTSDVVGNYVVVVDGLDRKGKAGSSVYRFTVTR